MRLSDAIGLEIERREALACHRSHPHEEMDERCQQLTAMTMRLAELRHDIERYIAITSEQQGRIEALEHKLQRILGTQEDDSIATQEDALAKIYLICRETDHE